ncbi:hypothetical protein JKP88DRAFT_134603, partial [Tribonema minus]
EYNLAHGHLTSQSELAASGMRVAQIDVYETSEKVAEQYRQARSQLAQASKDIEELWVLHGTSSSVVPNIMCGGFKVGGREGIPIRHGSQHGEGVYTSTQLSIALSHTSNESPAMVIMARALKGAHIRSSAASAAYDSWSPSNNWYIFKSGAQLLPVYVIHL